MEDPVEGALARRPGTAVGTCADDDVAQAGLLEVLLRRTATSVSIPVDRQHALGDPPHHGRGEAAAGRRRRVCAGPAWRPRQCRRRTAMSQPSMKEPQSSGISRLE